MTRSTQYIATARDGERASFEPSPALFDTTELRVGDMHQGACILAIGTLEVVTAAMAHHNAGLEPSSFIQQLEKDGSDG